MKRRKNQKTNYDKVTSKRFSFLFVMIVLLFIAVIVRIVQVMVYEKKIYQDQLQLLTYSTVSGTSSPRGRIYDRNYHILVDNKSLKTITYQKKKGVSNLDMIEVATRISPHINVDYSRLTDRSKKEYYFAKERKKCDQLVTKKEKEKVEQRKMTQKELNELKLERIPEEDLEFSLEEQKVAYLFYLMNKGYTYEEKIIKSDVTDEEYAYVSEHSEELEGFNTKIDWERVYPYGEVFKSIL